MALMYSDIQVKKSGISLSEIEYEHYNTNVVSFTDMIDWFLVFNATSINISAISWRPVLVVEEAGVPGENHRPWVSNW
jgi:hypothetical protein